MIRRVRTIMLALGLLAAALVSVALLVDEGEIVTLISRDDGGMEHETQLWIVQVDQTPYLRAANPEVEWLGRIESEPLVTIEREDEVRQLFLAATQTDQALKRRVNLAMAQKYGLADRIWGLLSSRSSATPIRLSPAPLGSEPLSKRTAHENGAP